MNPRAVLAEDESLLREQLRELLAAAWPELSIVALAEDGRQAMHALEEHRPDVLFLDIEMPGLTGLEVAAQASRRCHVVFVTAYDKYALAAFEQGAVDYVLKPFSQDRLADTVARLKERLHTAPADLGELLAVLSQRDRGAHNWLRWIRASVGADVSLVTVDEVIFFQADNKYTMVVTADSEFVIRKSIAELAQELDPEVFWQIHRGTIVNLNEIAAARRRLNGSLELRLKRHPRNLVVSTTYAHLFKQM